MLWVVAYEDSVSVREVPAFCDRDEMIRLVLEPDVCYAGFLMPGLQRLQETLSRQHARFLLNFRAGWGAVAAALRCGDAATVKALGDFTPPTSPGPRPEAPLGSYLLDRRRWSESLLRLPNESRSVDDWAVRVHRQQRDLGGVFLDPRLEWVLNEAELPRGCLEHRRETLLCRCRSAWNYLVGGGGVQR